MLYLAHKRYTPKIRIFDLVSKTTGSVEATTQVKEMSHGRSLHSRGRWRLACPNFIESKFIQPNVTERRIYR